jgi:hypothetical protein
MAPKTVLVQRQFRVEVFNVQLHVADLTVAVQIGSSARHGALPLRHLDLIFLVEDACHSHHQVGLVVRDDVNCGGHVSKWPRTGCIWTGTSARPRHPQMVLKWTTGGGGRACSKIGGTRGQLAVGVAHRNRRRPWQWRAERGNGAGGRAKLGEGWGNASLPLPPGPGSNKRGIRSDTRAVRADAFRSQI